MTIESLLTRPISTLPATATCAEAARRMRRQNIGSVVVERDGAPVGMITDRDLAMHIVAEERDPARVAIGTIMSRFPAFLAPQRDLRDAIDTMREMGVRRLPVVNAQGRLIGMLSLDDILIELSNQFVQIKALLSSEASHIRAEGASAA